MSLGEVLDRVIAYAAKDSTELVAARELWADAAGKVYDDDPLYEERAAAFLEWFTLERPGNDGRTPAQRYLATAHLEDMDGRWVHALDTSHRSLFEIVDITDGIFELHDLLTGCRFSITERRKLPGLEINDLFEARLVADIVTPPQLLFSKTMLFHPPIAASAIRAQAVIARSTDERRMDTLFRLARLRVRALRYGHVSADRIYAAWRDEGATPPTV